MTNAEQGAGSPSSFEFRHSSFVIFKETELGAFLLGCDLLDLRRKRQFKPEALGEALRGFGREAFKMIAHKCPDVAHLGEMPLDFERPALECGFAFPEQSIVAVHEQPVLVVLGGVVAE